MAASIEGKVECVRMLLDKGAEVNMQDKVSGVIIHWVYVMQYIPRVLISVCMGTLFRDMLFYFCCN